MTYDIIGKRFWYFLISGVLAAVAILGLIAFGLRPSVEFQSGSIIGVKFAGTQPSVAQITSEVESLGYNTIVQVTQQGEFLIRVPEITSEQKASIESDLTQKFGSLTETQFSSVSPLVAFETVTNSALAVAIAIIGELIYIIIAFRVMPKPFRYGVATIVALLHDNLIAIGTFAIFGKIFNWQMDLMFVTAILTIIGYGINNIIVVLDKIRENVKLGISYDFATVCNASMIETLPRCMNTSITTLIAALALILFVGAGILNFAVVFVVGLLASTLSATFITPSLLVVWDKKEWGRFIFQRRINA